MGSVAIKAEPVLALVAGGDINHFTILLNEIVLHPEGHLVGKYPSVARAVCVDGAIAVRWIITAMAAGVFPGAVVVVTLHTGPPLPSVAVRFLPAVLYLGPGTVRRGAKGVRVK